MSAVCLLLQPAALLCRTFCSWVGDTYFIQVRHELRESGVDLVPTLIHELLTLQAAAEKIMVSVEASRAPDGSYNTQAERGSPHIPFP